MKVRTLLITVLVTAGGLASAAPASADRSPANCNANKFDVNLSRDRFTVKNGDIDQLHRHAEQPQRRRAGRLRRVEHHACGCSSRRPTASRAPRHRSVVDQRQLPRRDRRPPRSGRSRTPSAAEPGRDPARGQGLGRERGVARRARPQRGQHQPDDRLGPSDPAHRGRQDRRHQERPGAAERDLHLPRLQPHRTRRYPLENVASPTTSARASPARRPTATPTATTSSIRPRSGSTRARWRTGPGRSPTPRPRVAS